MQRSEYIAITTEDNGWVAGTRFANLLLKMGSSVVWTQERFAPKGERPLSAGTFIIPLVGPLRGDDGSAPVAEDTVVREAERRRITTRSFSGPLDTSVTFLKAPRVALFADAGSVFPFASVLSEVGIEYEPMTSVDIRNDELQNHDVLVIPGGGAWGGGSLMNAMMGEGGRQKVKEFVHRGGALWGSCAGCKNIVHIPESTLTSWRARQKTWPEMCSLELLNAEFWSTGKSGVGKLVVENKSPTHPIMFGMPKQFEMVWHLGSFLTPLQERTAEASMPIPLVEMRGYTKEWTSCEYLYRLPSLQSVTGAMKNTYVGKGIAQHKLGIAAGYYGRGKVCGSGGHPEFGMDWLLEKWGGPARMVVNFVLWAVSSESAIMPSPALSVPAGYAALATVEQSHKTLSRKLGRLRKLIRELESRPLNPLPKWLENPYAESTFGITAAEKWPNILKRLRALPGEVEAACADLERVEAEASALVKSIRGELSGRNAKRDGRSAQALQRSLDLLLFHLQKMSEACNYRRPAEWVQDYGWQGAGALLDAATTKMERALRNYHMTKIPRGDYTLTMPMYLDEKDTPYRLVWGWYLGAIYDLLNATTVLKGRAKLASDALEVSDVSIRRSRAAGPK